jgi:hypothetical protein
MALQKTKNLSRLRWPRDHKLISLLVIIALLVGGYFVYEAVVLRMNKHDFEQARAAIDVVYADIVSRVGQPDNYKKINYCARAHQEFTPGSISCDSDTSIIYSVDNENEANSVFKRIQKIINSNSSLLKPTSVPDTSLKDSLVVDSAYHAASDKYRSHGLSCIANYIYDTPREIDLSIKDKDKKPFEVTIGCYGPARQAYYSLAY